jgi:uncharacterized membrane protein
MNADPAFTLAAGHDPASVPSQAHPGREAPSRVTAGLWYLIAIAVAIGLAFARSIWAATALSLIITLTVPGLLALRALRIPSRAVRRFPLYVLSMSLLVLFLAGLSADLIGPLLGVAHPLHGAPCVLAELAICLLCWLAGLSSTDYARVPGLASLPTLTELLPFLLPALAAAGALVLSRSAAPALARIATGGAVLGFLLSVGFARRLSGRQLVVILFSCALATEWAFSLRSSYIIGFDISTEIHLAEATRSSGIWHANQHGNAYGAMLSISILPSVLSALSGLSPLIAFKLLYPALAATLPCAAYLIGSRFLSRRGAMAAAGLVIVQNTFFQELPQLARQEVALVFFASLIAVLVERELSNSARARLAFVISVGSILAHYSTTYVALIVLGVALVVQLVLLPVRRIPRPTIALVAAFVTLLGGSVLWYGTITNSSSNVSQFKTSLTQQGLDLFPTSSTQRGIVNKFLSGNVVTDTTAASFQRMAVHAYASRKYIHPLPAASKREYRLRPVVVPGPRIRSHPASRLLTDLVSAFGLLILALGFFGSLAMMFWRSVDWRVRMVGLLSFANFPLLILIRFSGTVAQSYNQSRELLQALMLVAFPAVWLVIQLVQRLNRSMPKRSRRLVARRLIPLGALLALAVLYVSNTGVAALLIGGGTSLNLSQSGEDFDRLYPTADDIAGAVWVNDTTRSPLLYADRYGQLRLYQAAGRGALQEVTPRTLDRSAWIYATSVNIVQGQARGQVDSYSVTYAWPRAFIDRYFNTVFSDGTSEVFHR